MGKMGFIVSDGDGNEIKLSKYFKMSKAKGRDSKVDRGSRELKKLEWDMMDGSVEGVGENSKRHGRVGSTNGDKI